MRKIVLLVVFGLVVSFAAEAKQEPPPELQFLTQGEDLFFVENLPVNIVLIGLEWGGQAGEVDPWEVLENLPPYSLPVIRQAAYGKDGSGFMYTMGIGVNFQHTIYNVSSGFEDWFFWNLGLAATPAPLTDAQQRYNTQTARSLTIQENVEIDATLVEEVLAAGLSYYGVDTFWPTLVFINWHGRDDFVHHVYVKPGEVDPDTGADFGADLQDHKLTAWGGTAWNDPETGSGQIRRIWFYDFSAGPEGISDNWNIDDPEPDAESRRRGVPNGIEDYRIPPSWEYGNMDGYRPFDSITRDLTLIARYLGIDAQIGASPIYDPILSAPLAPDTIQLDINSIVEDGVFEFLDFVDPAALVAPLQDLLPFHTFSVDATSAPLSKQMEGIFDNGFSGGKAKYGQRLFGDAFWDLSLFLMDHILQYLEGATGYELPIFAFAMDEDHPFPFLGFAEGNHGDTTVQNLIMALLWPNAIEAGYGGTDILVHEIGHHLGMSHPHDGLDFHAWIGFTGDDCFQFAWTGDQTSSVMSYLHANNEFSQFDQDNLSRWLTASYINLASSMLPAIYKKPGAGAYAAELLEADYLAWAAKEIWLQYRDYTTAQFYARAAYDQVVEVSQALNIPLEPAAWQGELARAVNQRPGLRKVMRDYEPVENWCETIDPLHIGGPGTAVEFFADLGGTIYESDVPLEGDMVVTD